MNCIICGKSEIVMSGVHKECINNLWETIAKLKAERESLRKELDTYKQVVDKWKVDESILGRSR